jgi:hypothetical protein
MLLTLVILTPTAMLPGLARVTQAEAAGKVSQKAGTGFSGGASMNSSVSVNDSSDLPQLAHILADAYGNALMHDTASEDSEAEDLLLESASIRFASRMVYEITEGSCQRDEHSAMGASADRTCVLDNESVDLADLSDRLSYAAYRLEDLGRSSPSDGTNSQRTLDAARIASMEHLYRMVFALSRSYLDRSQSGVYLEAAREQLGLARKHMEVERSLCACDDHEYTARLLELSELEDQLEDMRRDATLDRKS